MTHSYLIGISGGSASGKTSFLKSLRDRFSPAELSILSQDNYYRSSEQHPRDEQGYPNYDLPECIDLESFLQDLNLLKAGQSASRYEYRFQLSDGEAELIETHSAPVVVVEGLFLFHIPEIFDQLHLKIFIEADEEIKFRRRMERDTRERGIEADFVSYQWQNHVRPSYEKFLLPHLRRADLVLYNNTQFDVPLEIISNHIKLKINEL